MGEVSRAADQLAEGGGAGSVDTQGDRVGEEADHGLQLGVRPIGHRRRHTDLVLGRVAGQQGPETGQQHHVRRRTLLAGECLHRLPAPRRQCEPVAPAAEALRRGPRPVERKVDHRGRAAKRLAPVGQRLGHLRCAGRLRLPGGEVGVLERQRLEIRVGADHGGAVAGEQFVDQDAHRQPVADTVVQREDEDVVGGPVAEQSRSYERSVPERERPRRLGFQSRFEGDVTIEQRGREVDVDGGRDPLHGSVTPRWEGGSQGLVPVVQFAHRAGEDVVA